MFRPIAFLFFCLISTSSMGGTVFMAGDSTMSIKKENKRPETGWGEVLVKHLNSPHQLVNMAINGRSTRDFLEEGRWYNLLQALQAGDMVIIEFGHNDQKITSPYRFTDPWRDYRYNLERFIADVRAKDATPILLNSIARRRFEADTLVNTHAPYDQVVRDVANSTGVLFIDMTKLSSDWLNTLGDDSSKRFFLHVEAGHRNYPNGVKDDTHLNPAGAAAITQIFLEALYEKSPELRQWFAMALAE
jgi:lysophospholipase L1-like esterase